jgi:hypothetical protein
MEPSQLPVRSGPGRRSPGEREVGRGRRRLLGALAGLAAVIAGTAALGAATGFLWASLAPRALAVVVARGSANVVNPETNAFIAADGWFTLLTLAGGVVSGLLGYALAVRRHGALAMAGVLAGALAATLIAMWIGQRSGTAAFNHGLAVDRPGTLLRVPLMLGGHGPLTFWPIAAGLTAGGTELIAGLRERRHRPAPLHAYAAPRYWTGEASAGAYGPAGEVGHGVPDGFAGRNGTGPEAPPRLSGPTAPGQPPDPRD